MVRIENGFTLVELLFTLSVIAIIASLSVPLLFSSIEKHSENQFLTLFEQDVFSIQNQSFGTNEYIRLIFRQDYYVIIHGNRQDENVIRNYPDHLTVSHNNSNIISFNNNGTIMNPGTISMTSKHMNKELVFPFGKGR